MIVVTIPGELRGKGRPRFGKGFAYTDTKTRNAEAWVKHCACQAFSGPPLADALIIELTIGVAVPASWPKKRRQQALDGLIWPTGKPDLDNVLKLVGDACNGILWADDKQIVRAVVSRRYVEAPSATLSVYEV